MSLIVEDIFLVGSSLFHQGCSADSCDFGVPMRGGELVEMLTSLCLFIPLVETVRPSTLARISPNKHAN